MEPFMGMILLFGADFLIRDWRYCNGDLVSISQNSALFSVLGVVFGGNGSSTFGLPDLRGRVPVGMGQGAGLQNYIMGQKGGLEATTILLGNMPLHNHTVDLSTLVVTPGASTTAGTSNIPGPTLVPATLPAIGGGPNATTIKGYGTTINSTLAPSTVSGSATVGLAGGTTPMNTQDPYLVMNYMVAMYGIYPTRI